MPVKSGWASFLAISWGLLNSILTSDFGSCLKCKHTVGGVLEHSFCLVRLMECIILVSEWYWISDAILWRFLESYTNWVGPLRMPWIRWGTHLPFYFPFLDFCFLISIVSLFCLLVVIQKMAIPLVHCFSLCRFHVGISIIGIVVEEGGRRRRLATALPGFSSFGLYLTNYDEVCHCVVSLCWSRPPIEGDKLDKQLITMLLFM